MNQSLIFLFARAIGQSWRLYCFHQFGGCRNHSFGDQLHAADYGSALTTQVRAFSSALFRPFTFASDRRDPFRRGRALTRTFVREYFRPPAPCPLQRRRDEQDAGVPHQLLRGSAPDHCRFVQKSVASGAFLQMGEAASSHQAVLRDLGKCGEDPDLDRRRSVRARRHCQEATKTRNVSLHFSSDPFGQGRLAEPDEVAAAILFLASPAASMITGHILAVDGGFLAQ